MSKKICVMGLGYIGLPTASMFSNHGFQVLGVDVNPNIVETVNSGQIHIEEPGLRTLVTAGINSGQLRASTAPEPADVFIIAVPTPCRALREDHRESDLSFVEAAMNAILPVLAKGNLIILESTSPPGTTKKMIVVPLQEAGFTIGTDIFVAHCPERVLPGYIMRELTQNDRVIGGITSLCAKLAADLYRSFVEGAIHVTNATTAELVKLMENTYRDVNIALANELANICDHLQVDASRVIELANCHPRVNIHSPGPGVGGHCLPLDPWFVIESAPKSTTLIRTARLLNQSVPAYLADRINSALHGITQPKVAIFGVAYKGNVDDARETPASDIIRHLYAHKNAPKINIYDPHVRHFEHDLSSLEETVTGADAIVVTTAHSEFKYLDPLELKKLVRKSIVFDLCNLLDRAKWTNAGFTVIGRGDGTPAEKRALELAQSTSKRTSQVAS